MVEKVVTQTVTVTNRADWKQLESEDYREYITRLRSIGCPEQTIRDLIIADLDKLYAPKIQSLQGRRKELAYWHSEEEELANDVNKREQQAQQRQIDKEKRRVIEELLGIDLVRERLKQQGQEDYYERRLSFLPEGKRDQVRNILEDFAEQEEAIRNKELQDGEPITPADRAQLRELQEQRQASLAANLKPEEVTQLELWMSPTADTVRHDLYGMNATQEEFQTIYGLRKAFDQQWGQQEPELMTDGMRGQYQTAKAELDAQIQERLGPARFAEYQRGSDQDFHRLSATVTRYNLPRQTATQVYELKRTYHVLSEQVSNNATLSEEQKATALKAMSEETQMEVRSLLGEGAFKYYLWKGQAYWFMK